MDKSSKSKRIVIVTAAAAVIIGAGAVGAGVWASQDDESQTRGTIGSATYELSAEAEDDGVEVNFELQSAAPGETWQVVVEQNGTPILQGERTTDEDAELDLDVTTRDLDGTDTYTVTVTGPDDQQHTAEITR